MPLLVVSAYTGTYSKETGWSNYISGACGGTGEPSCPNYGTSNQYDHDFGSILNFIQYAFGLTQGGISGAAPSWFYDDYWASDYGGNHVSCQGNQQLCPYGLSDFFNFSDPPRSFVYIAPQTYQPSSFVNLQGFGGVSATEPPDEETP